MVEDVLEDAERRMKKAVEHVRGEFATVRTGRASASLLNRVNVDYYGQSTPLNQISSIAVPEPTLLVISPYDKSVIDDEYGVRSRIAGNEGADRTEVMCPADMIHHGAPHIRIGKYRSPFVE